MDCLKMAVGKIVGVVSSMTKGEMKMKNKMIALVAVMMMLAGSAFAATATTDVDIYVTPGSVTASLTALTTYYNFGTVDLNTSSHSITGLVLQNDSASTVSMEKSVESTAGGTVNFDYAADGQDEFALYCLGDSATQPAESSFVAAHQFNDYSGTEDTLANSAGTDITAVPVGHGTTTWYKITMPPSVSSSAQRQFNLLFTATTN